MQFHSWILEPSAVAVPVTSRQRPNRSLLTLPSAGRDHGLGYDVLIRGHQLPQVIRLAETVPDLRIVLASAGKPPITGGDLTDRERQIRLSAGHPQARSGIPVHTSQYHQLRARYA